MTCSGYPAVAGPEAQAESVVARQLARDLAGAAAHGTDASTPEGARS